MLSSTLLFETYVALQRDADTRGSCCQAATVSYTNSILKIHPTKLKLMKKTPKTSTNHNFNTTPKISTCCFNTRRSEKHGGLALI